MSVGRPFFTLCILAVLSAPSASLAGDCKELTAGQNLSFDERRQRAVALALEIQRVTEKSAPTPTQVAGQQYFTRTTAPLEQALQKSSLKGKTVLEFGAGTGIITLLIESAAPARLHAWERDPMALSALHDVVDPSLTQVHAGDFISGVTRFWDQAQLQSHNVAIVSNPPYGAIPFIVEFAERHEVPQVLLYAPVRMRDLFSPSRGWKVLATLGARDFFPFAPSYMGPGRPYALEGNHFVVARGFDAL